MSEFLYEVGDEFEGGPIQQNKFITEVLQSGGLVGIDGDIVRILYLPGKGSIFDKEEQEAAAKQVVVTYVSDAELAANAEPGLELSPAEDLAAVEEAVVESLENEGGPVVTATKPASKRGRPRKVIEE